MTTNQIWAEKWFETMEQGCADKPQDHKIVIPADQRTQSIRAYFINMLCQLKQLTNILLLGIQNFTLSIFVTIQVSKL
jgi:hypothetical protein